MILKQKFDDITCFIFLAVCIIGSSVQIYDISDRYIRYPTRSQVDMTIPISTKIPLLSSCFHSFDILNLTKLSRNFGINLENIDDSGNFTKIYVKLENLTAKNWFELTPSPNEILESKVGCFIRFPSKYVVDYPHLNRSACLKNFIIKKYLHRGFICYKFQAKTIDAKIDLKFSEYVLSPNYPEIIYKMFLSNKIFQHSHYFTSFAHGVDTSHFYDSIFSSISSVGSSYNRNADDKRDARDKYLKIDVTYNEVKIDRLKYPYDTECQDFKRPLASGFERALKSVRDEMLSDQGRLCTFSHIHEEASNSEESKVIKYPLITTFTLRNNHSFKEQFSRSANKRSFLNAVYGCHIKYYISKMSVDKSAAMSVSVTWPQGYDIHVQFLPVQELVDLLLYISSSINIWYGLSALSLLIGIRDVITKYQCCKNRFDMARPASRGLISRLSMNRRASHVIFNSNRDADEIHEIVAPYFEIANERQIRIDTRFDALIQYTQMRLHEMDAKIEKLSSGHLLIRKPRLGSNYSGLSSDTFAIRTPGARSSVMALRRTGRQKMTDPFSSNID